MSRITNNITIVCYDIVSNKLRSKIDKCMKDFGKRIQFSIFLCRLDTDDVKRCKASLKEVLEKFDCEKEPEDSIIIFERLSPDNVNCLIGAKIERNALKFFVL